MSHVRTARRILAALLLLGGGIFMAGCSGGRTSPKAADDGIPRYLKVEERPSSGWTLISVSPFDGSEDTLVINAPLERLIVMSTSHVGFLDALGASSSIVGLSGKDYVYREASEPPQHSESIDYVDVGYDAAPDYEKILTLKPDLLLTYTVSAAKSPFLTKLNQLGIRVFIVNEHLESHPLARAAYVRLFGVLTGRMAEADSVLSTVKEGYNSLTQMVANSGAAPRKVLLNIPYNDQWFVPSRESYLSAMVRDAGGEVLGSKPGRATSSCMSVESAYSLSREADCWLNVGWCQTLGQLLGVNPVFSDIASNIRSNATKASIAPGEAVIWNDNNRLNPKGGNDIWQSGVVRPDLVLGDLVRILHPSLSPTDTTIYYRPLTP